MMNSKLGVKCGIYYTILTYLTENIQRGRGYPLNITEDQQKRPLKARTLLPWVIVKG